MGRPRKLLSIFASSVLVLTAAVSPSKARPLEAIRADHTLKVGLTGDYAPFAFRDENGEYTGADVMMAISLAKALGLKLVVVPMVWKTLTVDLAADKFDIVMGGVSVTRDRADVGYFSEPVLLDGKRPIVRCADKDRYTSITAIDKPEVRVVVVPGGTNERFDKTNFPHAQVTEYGDNRTIFNEVEAGRADVIMTDGEVVDFQSFAHHGTLCPASVPEAFDHYEKAYLMTRDPALKKAVDAWLIPNLQSGLYKLALAYAAAGIGEGCSVSVAHEAHAKRRLNIRH